MKKDTNDSFDVTMGSFDRAEICELVGLLILNKLSNLVTYIYIIYIYIYMTT